MAGRFADTANADHNGRLTDSAGGYHILKELAIVSEDAVGNSVFHPPYDFETFNSKAQRTAHWLTTQFHGLA